MMNILIVPDKFKGSLTANEVVRAIKKGITRFSDRIHPHEFILSDGGDGFLDAIPPKSSLKEIRVPTVDPLGRNIDAPYLLNTENQTAYIELAKASGIELLKEAERDVMLTSTYGTGLQIKDAISKGATNIYIGLGGSATNDAGIGIAKALGYRFLNKQGVDVKPVGANLSHIHTIEKTKALKGIEKVSFFAVNDVDNPLFGSNGAAHVYGKQKGASTAEIKILDTGLVHLDQLAVAQLDTKNAFVPGSGAAGGTAYGLKTFLRAQYIKGITFLIGLAAIPELLQKQSMDYIITGEGMIDSQTAYGKLVKGVIDLGQAHAIPVVAVCGKLNLNIEAQRQLGLEHAMEIYDATKGVAYSMDNAALLVEEKVFDFFKDKNQSK